MCPVMFADYKLLFRKGMLTALRAALLGERSSEFRVCIRVSVKRASRVLLAAYLA